MGAAVSELLDRNSNAESSLSETKLPNLRILHFSQTLPGGPASYLQEVFPAQARRFGEENLLCVLPSSHRHQVQAIPDRCFYGFESPRRTLWNLFSITRAFHRAVREFKPDIVHLHSTYAGGLARLPLLFSGPRKFAVIHCAHGWAYSRTNRPVIAKTYAAIERLLARVTDKIINISDYENALALSMGLPAEKLTTIRNGISATSPQSQQGVLQPPMTATTINLLFAGRHDRQKGLDVLLRAMAKLNRPDVPSPCAWRRDSGTQEEKTRLAGGTSLFMAGWIAKASSLTSMLVMR